MVKMKVLRFVLGPVGTNCYVGVNTETNEALVVDPGDAGTRLYEKLREEGADPVAILLTHGHFDHAGGIADLKEAAKKDGKEELPVYTCIAEKEVLKDPRVNLSGNMGGFPETYHADVFLNDGDELTLAGFTVRLLHTPGHTEGGCCFYLPEEGVLFSGDTLFCGSVGRTDFPGGSMSVLVRSIREKLFVLPDDTKVYPGHDSQTAIGDEKRYNPFLS